MGTNSTSKSKMDAGAIGFERFGKVIPPI